MRRILALILVCVSVIGCLCSNAGAIGDTGIGKKASAVEEQMIMRASGSFNMNVGAHRKTAADTSFPLAAGETVHIRANYAPENASLDFGLIDPDGIFHYINVNTGSIDVTIEVPENGNYTFAIRNNSDETVKVSGIVRY